MKKMHIIAMLGIDLSQYSVNIDSWMSTSLHVSPDVCKKEKEVAANV